MKQLSKLTLLASAVVLVVAIILSLLQKNIIAGPNGWLELSLVLAVLSVAVKYVMCDEKKE